jgi:TetR/AcrR family transcriptional regulator, transcriptional repressor for nem operon
MKECESKLRLLQTAHDLIFRNSYGSVGVDQICEQSGVKKGSFYHFFRSKSELTIAACEYQWEKSRSTLDRIFSAQIPPLERLEGYFKLLLENQSKHLEQHGKVLGCPYISLGSELSTQDEAVRLMSQQISDRKCRYLEATLRDAMDLGEIPKQDVKQLAQELHFYLVGLLHEAKIANSLSALSRMQAGAYRLIGLRPVDALSRASV